MPEPGDRAPTPEPEVVIGGARGEAGAGQGGAARTRVAAAWERISPRTRVVLVAGAAALLPLVVSSDYIIRVGVNTLIYALLALGLNIVVGWAGLLDLGYVAFYGCGAYAYAILSSDKFNLHWPAVVPAGGKLRHAPAHIIDFVPTVLALAGRATPESWGGKTRPALPGRSLVPLLKRDAVMPRDALYWHHEGNRALRLGDWKLVSESESGSWWELYNLKHDRIESHNLAAAHPDRVQQMSAVWRQLDDEFRRQAGE